MIQFGLALTMREAMYQACRENTIIMFPSVVDFFDSVCASTEAFLGYVAPVTSASGVSSSSGNDDTVALFDLSSVCASRSSEGVDVALLNLISRECFTVPHSHAHGAHANKSAARTGPGAADNGSRSSSPRRSVRMTVGNLRHQNLPFGSEPGSPNLSPTHASPKGGKKRQKESSGSAAGGGGGDKTIELEQGEESWSYSAFTASENVRNADEEAERQLNLAEQKKTNELFDNLPAACACLYLCEMWVSGTHLPEIGCWLHNEHTIPKAIEVLLLAFNGRPRHRDPVPSSGSGTSSSTSKQRPNGIPSSPSPLPAAVDTHAEQRLWSSAQIRAHISQECKAYMTMSSHILLHHKEAAQNALYKLNIADEVKMKMKLEKLKASTSGATRAQQKTAAAAAAAAAIGANPNEILGSGALPSELIDYALLPISSMCLTLESFAVQCPFAGRDALEKHLPYSIIHHGLVDVTLGKETEIDERQPF